MSEEVYLSNLEWTKTHDNIGCVMGNVVLKNSKSYEEYKKLLDTTYYILTTKEKIETITKPYLEEIERLNNIIDKLEIDIENRIYMIEPKGTNINFDTCNYECEEDYINGMELKAELNTCKSILNKLQELKGEDKK